MPRHPIANHSDAISRREALALLGALAAGACIGTRAPSREALPAPELAPGAPDSPERLALIDTLRRQAASIGDVFEARTHRSDAVMPYRLFHPGAGGMLPLVMYLHGSGGIGDDNRKQLETGNVFGTHVWALPENQARFPCFVMAPQADGPWIRIAPQQPGETELRAGPRLGDNGRRAIEIVDALCKELPIDRQRIYLTGQSMGGGGVWHLTAHRPDFFAAAVPCCGVPTLEAPSESARTPIWNFHGDADQTVPIAFSRDRITALRAAEAHPLATEYAGVGHNVWLWAYSEPALLPWVFGQRRS